MGRRGKSVKHSLIDEAEPFLLKLESAGRTLLQLLMVLTWSRQLLILLSLFGESSDSWKLIDGNLLLHEDVPCGLVPRRRRVILDALDNVYNKVTRLIVHDLEVRRLIHVCAEFGDLVAFNAPFFRL